MKLCPSFNVEKSCYQATGTTEEQVIDLIEKNEVPASFKISEATVTYAWVYIISNVHQQRGETLSKCLPKSLSPLDASIVVPPRMTSLLAKTKKLAEACENDEDVLSKLHVPAKQLYPSSQVFIGDECQRVGIDANSLKTVFDPSPKLTSMMVYELEIYRTKQGLPRNVLIKWLSNIVGVQHLSTIAEDALIGAVVSIRTKKNEADHHRNATTLMEMRQQEFVFPGERVKPETDVLTTVTKQLTASKKTVSKLQKDLKQTTSQLKRTLTEGEKTAKRVRAQETVEKEHANCKQLEKSLQEKSERLTQKENDIDSYCKPYNVKRREKTSKKNIADKEQKIQDQNAKISSLEQDISKHKDNEKQMSSRIKNMRQSRGYYVQKTSALQKSEEVISSQENEKLKQKVKQITAEKQELKRQLDYLADELEDLRERNKPHLREENGEISNAVWECYVRLMALGVSAKNMSKVTEAVLTIICNFEIQADDLPKATSCRKVPMLANALSSYHVATEVKKTTHATAHSDGTSRDGVKVIDFEVTVEGGRTFTTGILPVAAGDANTQLKTFAFMTEKLGALIDKKNGTKEAKEIVKKIKNTMGDQAATQRSFNEKLEEYRKNIVPEVTEKWDELEDEEKDELLSMNHFYCHLHGLIGFATYCDKGMQKLEDLWRSTDGQLGVEGLREFQDKAGKYTWKHDDSATQRLVRTACSAFASGGDQKSGAIGPFRTFLNIKGIPRNELKTFRANRFNVLFANAASVFYHHHHIKEMFDGGYIKASNKLLRAVLADITCGKLVASIRALGILHKQFTEPYWRLIEHPDVPILKLTDHIKKSHVKLQEWSTDATPLLNKEMPPVFILETGEELVPIKDHIFDELYEDMSLQNATKQALEVSCCSLLVVYKRRFADHLEGKYSGPASQSLTEQTKDTLKSNKRGENDFGYWAWVAASKPTMTHLNTEGQCLYRLNRTDQFLETLRSTEPAEYRRVMKLALRGRRALHDLYNKLSEDISLEKERRMEEHRADQQRKKDALNKKLAARKKTINDHGGECKTKHEVETFLNSSKSKTEKTHIAKLHIQLIKDTYDLTDLPNRKELVKVTKSTEVLARDLCTLVEFVHQPTPEVNDQNDTAEYTESAVDITHIKDQIRDQLVSVGVGGRKSQDVSARRLAADETTRNEKPTQPRERDEESDEEESEDDLQDESSESEDDMEDESTESDDDDAAEMETDGKADLKVGDIVVAAWEDTWYPGEIIQVQGTNQHDQVIVSYMQRSQGNQNRFSWPPKNKLDIQPTLIAAIIHRDIILTPGESLRYVCIEKDMLVTLNKKYNKYYNSRIAL